jgi:hypothetical protein
MGHKGNYSVEDWLGGCVNFYVPRAAVEHVCASRGINGGQPYSDVRDEPILRLLKADLFRWIILGAGKVNNTSDKDNGWSHSGGGYALSEYDKKLLLDEANGIYEELEPESVFGKKKIRMRSAGIMPAARDHEGTPLPRRPLP